MDDRCDKILHPDVCRCCLANIGIWDLTKGYNSTGSVKEVLADLMQDSFGISISYLTHEEVSRLVCDVCAGNIRTAVKFRQQVQAAEQRFSEYIMNKERGTEEHFADPLLLKIEEIDIPKDEPLSPVEDINHSPVDVAIEISSKSQDTQQEDSPKAEQKKFITEKNTLKAAPKTENVQPHREKRTTKNTLLNRSIRMNTAIILKNSTVVPFFNKRCNNGKYTCFYCEMNFFRIQEMRNHINESHDDITVDEIITILKTPVFKLTKAEISQVRCKICGQDVQNLDNLIKHLIDVHKKAYNHVDFKPSHGMLGTVLESDNPTCSECGKEFPFLRALVTHMSEQHINNFSCDKCDRQFLFKRNLDEHILHSHDERSAKFKCKFCDETFSKSWAKQYHMKKVHGHGSLLKCVECGAAFSQHKQRVRHVVEVHNYKQPLFKCERCPKVFTSSSAYYRHIKTHSDISHNCNICSKKMTSETGLRKHLRIHSGERPYACQYCEKRFKSHGTLTTHERGHTNDKRYVCEICDAAFIQIHCLRRHYTSRHPDCGVDLKSIRAKRIIVK